MDDSNNDYVDQLEPERKKQLRDISPSFRRDEQNRTKPQPKAKSNTGKAAEGAGDAVKERGRDVAKRIAKQIAQRIAQAVMSAVSAVAAAVGWPVLAGCLIIFLIVMLVFGGLFASSLQGYFGKTPLVKVDKTKDKKLVTQFVAVSGDKAAQREMIADQAIAAKDALKKISTTNAEAQKIIAQINQLLDDIIALGDNPTAVAEKIKQILALLDKLRTLLPDQASQIDKIKNLVSEIQKMLDFYRRGHLVVNPKDLDYVRNYDADRRVVEMLVYLVTPTDQGGAGHERIKVKRIKFSYDTERKSASKETDYSDAEEPNVSAHYTGQAADIAEIDNILCTQIKRRRMLSDKKSKLPPIPIKVGWQTETGYQQAQGPEIYGANMHQVFNNLASGSINDVLIQQISDIVGIDLDPELLKGKNLGEISRLIGTAVLKQTLDIPGDYEMGNNLEDIVSNTGRALLAQSLNIPFEGIRGNSEDELMENIGRATLEKTMGLPAGSLAGANSDAILASIGRRQMEESLHISRDSLAAAFNNGNDFKRIIGQGRVEISLGIKPQTFSGNSTDELKQKLGKEMFEYTFANPPSIDNWLGLSTDTTEKLVNGEISPNDYNSRVGQKVYDKELSIYQKQDKQAEVYGVTTADLQSLIAGNSTVFGSMGKTILSNKLTVSDYDRGLIQEWLETKTVPTGPPGLDLDEMAGQYGLKENDLDKIFISNLASHVFQRIGEVQTLNNLTKNPELSPYLSPVKDFVFYKDRLELIQNYTDDISREATDPQVRAKAAETKSLASNLAGGGDIDNTRQQIKQIQVNVKFIEDKAAAANDQTTLNRIKKIKHNTNEMIEGKELAEMETLSADNINTKSDRQVGLTKKDVLAVVSGKKNVGDLATQIGLQKWEIEFDLPQKSLRNAYTALKQNNFKNADDTLLQNMGKAKVTEYGGLRGKKAEQVDKDLGLKAGTTADYQSGKINDSAFNKAVGMGVSNNLAANLINKQLDLTGDANYALTGTDIGHLFNGGWFQTALKIGGRSIDEAFGFPAGGTTDIINQATSGGDALQIIAEQKLGGMAGLGRGVSLNGDINYNLGRVKLEQELYLKPNALTDTNLKDQIKNYTGNSNDDMDWFDVGLGLPTDTTASFLNGGLSAHDYVLKVGEGIRNNVFYDQIAKYAPALKNKDIKDVVMDFANKTGTPEDILTEAGAKQFGDVLGLDYPVSIRGNFRDNLGQAKIEDRLGLTHNSFFDTIDRAIDFNGKDKFESAFYLDRGAIDRARNDSGYWTDDHKNDTQLIDAILNIPAGSTKDFLTGSIILAEYVGRAGKSALAEISVEKLADLMQLDDNYKDAATDIVSIISQDPSLNIESQAKLLNALRGVAGHNLDNMTRFDPGTWNKMLFVDPADPDHTGPAHADEIVLEQGKKYLPRWLGLGEGFEPFVDLIYEKATDAQLSERNEHLYVQRIQTVTGITDTNDARKFVTGDVRGALTAWGVSQLVQTYNNEFGAGNEFKLDYATVKKAYFNDPTGETAIGDAAVQLAQAERGEAAPLISASAATQIRQEAVREAREQSRKDLQYNVVDMQIHKIDKNIPSGFTKAMREGSSDEKWSMGASYIGNAVHNKNPNIPADLLPGLENYFNPQSPAFHDATALSGSTYGFLDDQMKDWFGDFVQPGTAQALFKNDMNSLTQIYSDAGVNSIANWGDKQSGLPGGTTKLAYDGFVKYQAARKAYLAAKATGDAAKIASSKASLNNLKADAIAMVVTFAFQKQLAAVDQKLGLVPGSSAMLVTMLSQQLIVGAINPWVIGMFVVTNLFGVYRVDVTCTACGYYPKLDTAPNQSCSLGEFDGKSADAFKSNSISAAQYKVNQLLGDILNMPSALKDSSMKPTQIMTLRQEDVDSFSAQLNNLYGRFSGNMGMWANETTWDYIHIGY